MRTLLAVLAALLLATSSAHAQPRRVDPGDGDDDGRGDEGYGEEDDERGDEGYGEEDDDYGEDGEFGEEDDEVGDDEDG